MKTDSKMQTIQSPPQKYLDEDFSNINKSIQNLDKFKQVVNQPQVSHNFNSSIYSEQNINMNQIERDAIEANQQIQDSDDNDEVILHKFFGQNQYQKIKQNNISDLSQLNTIHNQFSKALNSPYIVSQKKSSKFQTLIQNPHLNRSFWPNYNQLTLPKSPEDERNMEKYYKEFRNSNNLLYLRKSRDPATQQQIQSIRQQIQDQKTNGSLDSIQVPNLFQMKNYYSNRMPNVQDQKLSVNKSGFKLKKKIDFQKIKEQFQQFQGGNIMYKDSIKQFAKQEQNSRNIIKDMNILSSRERQLNYSFNSTSQAISKVSQSRHQDRRQLLSNLYSSFYNAQQDSVISNSEQQKQQRSTYLTRNNQRQKYYTINSENVDGLNKSKNILLHDQSDKIENSNQVSNRIGPKIQSRKNNIKKLNEDILSSFDLANSPMFKDETPINLLSITDESPLIANSINNLEL